MQRFSTEMIPARERLAAIHDFVGRHVAGRAFELQSNDSRIDMAVLDLPGRTMVASARYSPISGTRSRAMLADGRDDFLLTVHDEDHEFSVDGGVPMSVKAGELVAASEATASEFRLPAVGVRVVALSRARIAGLLPRVERSPVYRVPAMVPSLSLFSGYAALLHATPPEGEKARELATTHLHELAALLLDGFAGETERSERSIRAARLELVKDEVLKRLGEPGLSVGVVAKSQSVSPRYLQRLFEADGRTFSEFLRDSRLDFALRLLRTADPNLASIAAIAFEAGFNDLSNFNRGFRRRFGMTPSDVRAEAIRRCGH